MSSWDLGQLQRQLEKSDPSSLYLITGEEPFLLDEAVQALKNKVFPPIELEPEPESEGQKNGAENSVEESAENSAKNGLSDNTGQSSDDGWQMGSQGDSSAGKEFNYDPLYYPDSSMDRLQQAVETFPIMYPRRLVVYRGVESLKANDLDRLATLIDKPVDTTVLVLVSNKLDKRKKIFKQCKKNGVVVELPRPFDNKVSQWVDYMARKQEVILSTQANFLLRELVGNSLTDLNSELIKLKQFLGERSQVTEKDILEIVSATRENSIFDFTNALGSLNAPSALALLNNLCEQGQSELGILAMSLRHIRLLASTREAMRQGLKGRDLSQKVGVSSFFLNQYTQQCQKWDDVKVGESLAHLHEADLILKSAPIAPKIVMENLVMSICGGFQRRNA